MKDWKPVDMSFYFEILNIQNDNFVEVGVEDVLKIEREFGIDAYHDILGKYDKVIVSQQTEAYGMANKLKNFYANFDSDKIFVINDGFVCEKYLDRIYPTVPRENIFYNPLLSIWHSWNHVLSDNSRILAHSYGKSNIRLSPHANKINDGFRNIHNNDINTLCDYESKMDRDFKFIVLNNNYKPGRALFVDVMSDSFIKENWVSANFLQSKENELNWNNYDCNNFEEEIKNPQERDVYKYIRKDDYSKYENDNTGWNSCYEIIWTQHLNKAYIQPYWESCAWTDAVTDGHYMVNEKTLLPLLMEHLTIPLGIFYVDILEKLGYEFVKKIGDVDINETISQEEIGYCGYGKTDEEEQKITKKIKDWNLNLFNKINKINNLYSLSDIKDIYVQNYDTIKHNKELVKNHASDNNVIDELRKWILN